MKAQQNIPITLVVIFMGMTTKIRRIQGHALFTFFISIFLIASLSSCIGSGTISSEPASELTSDPAADPTSDPAIDPTLDPALTPSEKIINDDDREAWEWGDNNTYDPYPLYNPTNVPDTLPLEKLPLMESVSQYEFTWKFASPCRAGKFITSDWYVVGPCTVASVTPKPLFGDEVFSVADKDLMDPLEKANYAGKYARNGSELNPVLTDYNLVGWDSRLLNRNKQNHSYYDPALFVHFPITMKAGDILVSTQSVNHNKILIITEHVKGIGPAAVLTCVDKPQPADAFRPGFVDPDKKIYLSRNLKRDLLYDLPKPANTPDLNVWVGKLRRPWLEDAMYNYTVPKYNMPNYCQWASNLNSIVTLMLHLQFTAEEKEQLLIPFIQRSIDYWGVAKHAGGWKAIGGHGTGRKWPIVFAGMMLDDAEMKSPNILVPTVGADERQVSWGTSWTGYNVIFYDRPFWEWCTEDNSPDVLHPKDWTGVQSEGYRRCCTMIEWPGQVLAARIMAAETIYNSDAWFAATDRWISEDHKWEIETIQKYHSDEVSSKWDPTRDDVYPFNHTHRFEETMWKTYRHNLPGGRRVPINTTCLQISPPATSQIYKIKAGESLEITITSPERDAEIYYTTDGKEPTKASTRYNGPFNLSASAEVKARAYGVSGDYTGVASASYNINKI